jgi:hypothetical protein
MDVLDMPAGAAPLGYRGIAAPAVVASPAKVSAFAEVRGSSPCLTAQEGSPRCHRMPCGGPELGGHLILRPESDSPLRFPPRPERRGLHRTYR